MNRIKPPITRGDTGETVANLRRALLLLLERGAIRSYEQPDRPTAEELAELATEIHRELDTDEPFGGAAQKTVFYLQIQQQLGDGLGGEVEEGTAKLLNALLRELRSPDQSDAEYVVEGRVVDEQGRGISGVQVSLFEEDVTGASQLEAPVLTSADGSYHLTFRARTCGEGDYGELAHLAQRHSDGTNQQGATVLSQFTSPVRVVSGPDLWVGVGTDAQNMLARTEIIFNAPLHTQMPDLVLTRAALHTGLSDLERVLGLVSPRLKGLALAALSQAQIEFLARDCEEPLALVSALVKAAHGREQARELVNALDLVWPDVAELGLLALQFTLAVEGSGQGFAQLLSMRDEDVARTLEDGIARGRITRSVAQVGEALVPWLSELRSRYRLSARTGDAAPPLGLALATLSDGIRPEGEALLGVAKAFDYWGNDPRRFSDELRKSGLDERQISGVMRTLSLIGLTGGHVALIAQLQTDEVNPEHAALLDLAALDRQGWTAHVKNAGLPESVEPQDADAYVTGLLRGMEQRAPTAYIMARLADGRIACDPALIGPAQVFVTRNSEFRFGSDSVFVQFSGEGALEGVAEDRVQPLLQELLQVERIVRATPNLEAAEIVLKQGYGSAFEIIGRDEHAFVDELKVALPGGEAEARETFARAQGITDSAFAVFLALSPRVSGEGEVQLLAGTLTLAPSGRAAATSVPTRSAMTASGQAAQTATLAALFGNQDVCTCEACSAMGSPNHYLTELLMLLDRGIKTVGNSPLDVLLARRPDIAEIELDCDNSGRRIPYIDLLLELLEASIIEGGPLNTIPRRDRTNNGALDGALDAGNVPNQLIADFRERTGIDLGLEADAKAEKRYKPGEQMRWLVRGGGWRLLLLYSTDGDYRFHVFPQSGRTTLPESWAYPSQLLDFAYRPLASARYPWTLPFDLAETETDVLLRLLGSSVRAVGELHEGPATSTSNRAARLAMGMPQGEWNILTQVAMATNSPWEDWGFPNQPSNWERELRKVSTLKRRAGISHGDLLELIQCRFIQPSRTQRFVLTGHECNSDQMFLGDGSDGGALLDFTALRRIQLFIRLWRRLGWSMRDLDRGLVTFGGAVQPASGQAEAFTEDFLRHLSNVVRFCEKTSFGPELALAIFKPALDTHVYWRQEGTRAFAIPSTYDRFYADPVLNRPREPAFELTADRSALVRTPVAAEMPQLRLSDHVAVIAGALGCTAADVLALLPQGEVSIPPVKLTSSVDGMAVDLPETGNIVIEVNLGVLPTGNEINVKIQEPDPSDPLAFIDVPRDAIQPVENPILFAQPADGWTVHRYNYQPTNQRAKRLRLQATRTAGTAEVRLSVRVLTAPGLVTDELALGSLSLLTRHLLLARASKLGGASYRKLLDLTGAQPLSSPEAALDFLEQVRRMRGLGLTVDGLDELLRERFADLSAKQRAQAQACNALEALRAALAAEEAELTLEEGQAEAALRKALLETGWSRRLVDLVVSPELLGQEFATSHDASLEDLTFDAVLLPLGLSYNAKSLKWTAPIADSETALSDARTELESRLPGGLPAQVAEALDKLTLSVNATETRIQGHARQLYHLAQSFELPVFETDINGASDVNALRSIAIPEDWIGTLWFDAGRRKLCFKGPMTTAWRDELKSFGSSAVYKLAIDHLYTQALAFQEAAEQSVFSQPHATAAYNLLVSLPGGMQQRAGELLKRVVPMLRIRRAMQRVASVLEPRLGVAPPVAGVLLDGYRQTVDGVSTTLVGQGMKSGLLLAPDFVRSPSAVRITPEGFPVQFTAMRRLFKLTALAHATKLDGAEVNWLVGPWSGTGSPTQPANLAALLPVMPQDGTAAAWPAWQRWSTVMTARQRLDGSPGVLNGFVQAVEGTATLAPVARQIGVWAAVSAEEIITLLHWLGVRTDADLPKLREPAGMLHLVECLDWMRNTGCDATSLVAWSTRPLTMAAAARARQFARAKVGEAAWSKASRKPLDALRVQRRDALVTFEVHRRGLRDPSELYDSNKLYGELLVDPEMGACMETTRTRLAISSVQLFVQRIQLGLEEEKGNIPRDAINTAQWAWMQNYRIWEANLKVLLHSENYVDMSLRRDKTPPYQALEADLMQGDISAVRASAALTTYLDALEEVSRLQTVGMYRDTPMADGWPNFARQSLYFVGSTQTQPKKHFLRQYVRHGPDERDGTWTPWQLIDLDLQDTFYITPVTIGSELALFWLEFREVAEPVLPSNPQQGTLPNKKWNIAVQWSHLRSGSQWTRPSVLDLTSSFSARFSRTFFVLYSTESSSNIDRNLRLIVPYSNTFKDLVQISVRTNQAQLKTSFANPYTAQVPHEPQAIWNAHHHGFSLLHKNTNWLPVFAQNAIDGIRMAMSHQDIKQGFGFSAPPAMRIAGQDPSFPRAIVFDAGFGEILAQPRYENSISHSFLGGMIIVMDGAPRLVLSAVHHPQASDFRHILRTEGLSGFLSPRTMSSPAASWFNTLEPDRGTIPPANYPKLDVDFSLGGSYAPYNWELFFMIPFAVACELSKQQRFREAREWFHYVFDPTSTDTTEQGPAKYWNFLPFRKWQGTTSIQELVRKLADANDNSEEKQNFLSAIALWRQEPFDPHLVARFRPVAYQMAVVMAYLKNLIAWGDQLFRRDTMESLNEAAQFYVLAAQILGRPGEMIPPRTRPLTKAFVDLKTEMAGNSGATALSNPLVAAESVLPLSVPGSAPAVPVPRTLYFCVPANPAFQELRQTVQDRLFKLRNCMNIDGVVRELALFEPPIDPALLVKARAAGVDVAALLSETSAPPPIYRFNMLAQKASEVCNDVRSLGAALLSAMEKGDGEALARLRSEHELRVLASVRHVKQLQIDEAEASIHALEPSFEAAHRRLAYYLNLLSQVEDLTIPTGAAGPTVGSLLTAAVKTITTVGTVASIVAGITNPPAAAAGVALNQAISRATEALANLLASNEAGTLKVPMNAAEKNQLVEMRLAREAQNKGNDLRLVAQLLAKIPDFKVGVSGVASSPVSTFEIGGSLLSSAANFLAAMEDARASEHTHRSALHGILAGYQRRAAEWAQQALQAKTDIEQIGRQMAAAALRGAIAAQDLRNHDQQISNANQVDEFMRSKWTNQELYGWMTQQVSSVYLRSYQLAHDLAKRAEQAYQHELGLESSGFIRHGHWDGLKKGLLAGELLYHDIKRMEAAYLDANVREFEITRSISLRQLDAAALMDLRIDGQCTFNLPEWLFNMDYPEHWLRRIKSVSVTLPAVVGPYSGVSGTLTLLSGRVRRSPMPGARYDDEANFRSSNLAASSVAISSGQGDAGLFDFNLRDERFLPGEGAGLVDSQWRFTLPQHLRPFDYETISDLVLTVRYTARSSSALRQPAIEHLKAQLESVTQQTLLLDIKRDFPSEWTRGIGSAASGLVPFQFTLERRHFPYAFAGSVKLEGAGHIAWTRPDAGKRPVTKPQWQVTEPQPFRADFADDDDAWQVKMSIPASGERLAEVLLAMRYTVEANST